MLYAGLSTRVETLQVCNKSVYKLSRETKLERSLGGGKYSYPFVHFF